jgi:hypothetical protein
MSRTYLTFGDIAGKLHKLRIECTRCARRGHTQIATRLAKTPLSQRQISLCERRTKAN